MTWYQGKGGIFGKGGYSSCYTNGSFKKNFSVFCCFTLFESKIVVFILGLWTPLDLRGDDLIVQFQKIIHSPPTEGLEFPEGWGILGGHKI